MRSLSLRVRGYSKGHGKVLYVLHVLLSAVLQGALPTSIARLDLELDALVVAETGGRGSSGGSSGRRSRGRHFEKAVLFVCCG